MLGPVEWRLAFTLASKGRRDSGKGGLRSLCGRHVGRGLDDDAFWQNQCRIGGLDLLCSKTNWEYKWNNKFDDQLCRQTAWELLEFWFKLIHCSYFSFMFLNEWIHKDIFYALMSTGDFILLFIFYVQLIDSRFFKYTALFVCLGDIWLMPATGSALRYLYCHVAVSTTIL